MTVSVKASIQEESPEFMFTELVELESQKADDIVEGLLTCLTAASSELTEPDQDSIEQQVTAFFNSKGISVNNNDIEACHPLPQRNKADKPVIIIRFTNRKHKNVLLRQGRKLKGSGVYVNEHLTKKNGDIARKARFLRKQGKIQSTWTANCKVCIKLNGSPEEAKVLVIRDMSELDKYQ